MQAGRLSERIEVVNTTNSRVDVMGDSYTDKTSSFYTNAAIKLTSGDYSLDDGAYTAGLTIQLELHYYLRRRLHVGDIIKRSDNAVSGVKDTGGSEMSTSYEIVSVEPNRALNRVYVIARRLTVGDVW